MSSQGKPRVNRNPSVAVTTKKFDKATGRRSLVELRALRVGEGMVITAVAGEVVELKIVLIPAQGTHATELHLEICDSSASLPDAAGTHGTSA